MAALRRRRLSGEDCDLVAERVPLGVAPRHLVVHRPSLTIDGHTFTDVTLGGWAYGPEIGSAPVAVVVGGITASPFPFGDGRDDEQSEVEPWWPAMAAPGLIDPSRYTVLCPCWPGNGSTWQGFDDPATIPAISVPEIGRASCRERV